MSALKLPVEIERWLDSFIKKHGHAPRVLHIGNIANNAYNNAKLLNKAGLDCDVICHDYYHIMGCPEWEDADFEGDIQDQFLPDWESVALRGFQRPRWFAQGPLYLCVLYLLAKRTGDEAVEERWRALQESHPSRLAKLRPAIETATSGGPDKVSEFTGWLQRIRANLFDKRNYPTDISFSYQIAGIRNWLTVLALRKYPLGTVLFYSLRIIHDAFACLLLLVLVAVYVPLKLYKLVRQCLRQPPEAYKARLVNLFGRRFYNRAKELVRIFSRRFPERPDQLSLEDLKFLGHLMPTWEKLFRNYDIIQAYSTDPIYPLFAGRPYFAFEHGTLREIPLRETAEGRRAALSYSQATHVFVTNSDCIEAANRLAGNNITFLNHPYDEDHGVNVSGWRELRDRLICNLDADFLFFFPTRHDWVGGTGYADKANDVFLRAFCRLRQEGHRVGMVCCRWGANVEQSKELLAQYGLSKHILWSEPMGIVKFERTAKAAHIVVDQFKLGAFGGVMFKAMSLGVPICTYLDAAEMAKRFGEPPPVINCRTEDEVVAEIEKLIGNQVALDELSAAGRSWIKRHHSSSDTVIAQLSCYMKVV